MPSFTSSGAELRQLARIWRTGNKAFRELFDVLPKQPGEVYNKVVLKPDAPSEYRASLQAVNDAWIASQVKKATRDRVLAVRRQRQQLVGQGLSEGEVTKQLRPLRRSLRERREQLAQELARQSGIVSQVGKASTSSEAAKSKVLLVLLLGQYLEESA